MSRARRSYATSLAMVRSTLVCCGDYARRTIAQQTRPTPLGWRPPPPPPLFCSLSAPIAVPYSPLCWHTFERRRYPCQSFMEPGWVTNLYGVLSQLLTRCVSVCHIQMACLRILAFLWPIYNLCNTIFSFQCTVVCIYCFAVLCIVYRLACIVSQVVHCIMLY
jgi:hypothetical protein